MQLVDLDELMNDAVGSMSGRPADNVRLVKSVNYKDQESVYNRLIESLERLNKLFGVIWKGGLYLDWSEVQWQNDSWRDYCEPVINKKYHGIIELPNALSLVEAITLHLRGNPDDYKLFWGPTQSTKSITVCSYLTFLAPIEMLLRNRRVVTSISLPNQQNFLLSFQKEFQTLFNLHRDVKLCYKTKSGVKSVKLAQIQYNYHELTEGDNRRVTDVAMVKRNQRGTKDLEELAGKIKGNAQRLNQSVLFVNVCDEAQQTPGNGPGDVIECMLRKLHDPQFLVSNVYSTASPSELYRVFNSEPNAQIIKVIVDETKWYGYGKYGDLKVATLHGGAVIHPHEKIMEREFLAFVTAIENKSEDAYRIFLTEICPKLLVKNSPVMMIRPYGKNEECTYFAEGLCQYIKAHNLSIGILSYFGAFPKGRSLREVVIDDYIRKKIPCVVVTNRARSRMGDSYPYECLHYMDLFETSATYDTLVQGTVGRSQGHRMCCPTLWLRQAMWDDLQNLKGEGEVSPFDDRKKPLGYRVSGGNGERGQPTNLRSLVFQGR